MTAALPRACLPCLSLLLLPLLLAPHTGCLAQASSSPTASTMYQDYAMGDQEAAANILDLLISAALPDALPPSEWGGDDVSSTSRGALEWGGALAEPSKRGQAKRLLPPSPRYMASRGKRQPSYLAFQGARGKRQPSPGMFFGSRGRRLWESYQDVKRLSPNVFHGSRGKRLLYRGPAGEDEGSHEARDLLPSPGSSWGRRMALQQILSLGYPPDTGLHLSGKRQPPFAFHGARG